MFPFLSLCGVKMLPSGSKGFELIVFRFSIAAQRHVGGIKPAAAEFQNSPTATGSKTKEEKKKEKKGRVVFQQ